MSRVSCANVRAEVSSDGSAERSESREDDRDDRDDESVEVVLCRERNVGYDV